ncbi:ribonuclease HII [Caldisericum exile]|uniref:Ribonuclease HII n=1 Tax=Caldisericum exile (strain DSM 21853 / NBRC 104410 / AZM16c01) TaxID=511051 RepID=A0A7U6GE54_CALEA|nr:ribonuclease HII [Caldisericum exile]BAL80738.1 ribonuclease HII [Caldisericum exile AZM16c01]
MGKILRIGIDEVGRGPLAGPVVSAAIIIYRKIDGVKDSKKLTPKRRENLFTQIIESAVAFGIGVASSEEIDTLNILNATFLSMKRALENLFLTYEKKVGSFDSKGILLLVDGNKKIPELPYKQTSIISGDNLVYEISCASIIAKTYRDNIMVAFSKEFPQYGFERNKGYGTREHIEAILKFGLSPIHRKKFVRGINGVSLFG